MADVAEAATKAAAVACWSTFTADNGFTSWASNVWRTCCYHQSLVKHSTAEHSTAQHSTAQHSTAQHSTRQKRSGSSLQMKKRATSVARGACQKSAMQATANSKHHRWQLRLTLVTLTSLRFFIVNDTTTTAATATSPPMLPSTGASHAGLSPALTTQLIAHVWVGDAGLRREDC